MVQRMLRVASTDDTAPLAVPFYTVAKFALLSATDQWMITDQWLYSTVGGWPAPLALRVVLSRNSPIQEHPQ